MIATDALIFIALCLAVLAAIGVRNALSLKDIGLGLDRVASALEASTRGVGSHQGPSSAMAQVPGSPGPDEAEIAAAIATAARAVGRGSRPEGRT